MKILVTGANGYLGSGVVNQLISLRQEVIAADFAVNHINEKANRIACNLFQIENPYEFFDKPDILLHMAWRDGFKHNSDAHIDDLPKHYHFIKEMTESGVKQIAVMGTMHEIGFYEGAIDENTPCNPLSFYGISKNALRNATEVICKNNNVIFQWLRGYYIVGNTQYGASIFSKIMAAARNGQKVFPFTSGKNQYDFLDYDDFCKQVAYSVTQNEVDGIINICSGKPVSLAERVEQFIQDNHLDVRLEYGRFPDRPYDSTCVYGDNTKIEKILSKNK